MPTLTGPRGSIACPSRGSGGRRRRPADDLIHDPRLVAGTFACQLAIILLDSLTLWLACPGDRSAVEPWVAFAGFTIGSIVAMIAPSPLGLGTFEAGTTAHAGAAWHAARSGTVVHHPVRGFTFWLPMVPGLGWRGENSPTVRGRRRRPTRVPRALTQGSLAQQTIDPFWRRLALAGAML